MLEEKKIVRTQSAGSIHNLIIEGRKKLSLSGVNDVESFDEDNIMLHTELGVLEIKGEQLHLNKLNLESGEVIVEGNIISAIYVEDNSPKNKGGLFSRIFK